jgi:hypothetical protein
MQPVDRAYISRDDVGYFRFVDDVLILGSSLSDVTNVAANVSRDITDIGLLIHPVGEEGSKSRIGEISEGFTFLGYEVFRDRISVGEASVRALENRLAATIGRGSRGITEHSDPILWKRFAWSLNLRITGCIFAGSARGWLPYYRQLTDMGVLRRLDRTTTALCSRFGVPHSVSVKKFTRAYWSVNGDLRTRDYVPNFDSMSQNEMRTHLRFLAPGTPLSDMSDEDVATLYRRIVSRHVADLEKDVGHLS